ncbi:hypothetical protein M3G03_09485 [Aestuariimicrobium sp. p3-SID1156]|uniref:hypothetical protein n=1 Tax=Aestuariimicrobium sp. p3-SID1156 TaxID=2916038 RepID=UPI00223A82CE|nr:hypothetical protein [Aestuariimicrobium sp. p3-SID1156]MCT1459767.1 hypothetical protein [Aestuariimicrobium sp. p3-SID1156]
MNAWLTTLEVLPGWPEPTPVSTMHLLLLCLFGPLLVGLVITAITWAPKLMGAERKAATAAGLGASPRGTVDDDATPVGAGGAHAARRSIES